MKLGEGGEAFFVFETTQDVPESLQTSPIVSPVTSPKLSPSEVDISASNLQEPEYLDLADGTNDLANNEAFLDPSFPQEDPSKLRNHLKFSYITF